MEINKYEILRLCLHQIKITSEMTKSIKNFFSEFLYQQNESFVRNMLHQFFNPLSFLKEFFRNQGNFLFSFANVHLNTKSHI
jgi:hypothetical protein